MDELSPHEVSEWLATDEGRIWLDRYIIERPAVSAMAIQSWACLKSTGCNDAWRGPASWRGRYPEGWHDGLAEAW